MKLKQALWLDLLDEGKTRLASRIEAGQRIAMISGRARIDFVLISLRDYKTLSALAVLQPDHLALLLSTAPDQRSRKALIRLIDWIELENEENEENDEQNDQQKS